MAFSQIRLDYWRADCMKCMNCMDCMRVDYLQFFGRVGFAVLSASNNTLSL